MVGNDPVGSWDWRGYGTFIVNPASREEVLEAMAIKNPNDARKFKKGFKFKYVKSSEECKNGKIVIQQKISKTNTFGKYSEYKIDSYVKDRVKIEEWVLPGLKPIKIKKIRYAEYNARDKNGGHGAEGKDGFLVDSPQDDLKDTFTFFIH
jgi:hypothetical protein